MKIADYSKVQELKEENIVLLDGPDGTRTILVTDLARAIIGLLSSNEFISPLKMSELDQADTVLKTNGLLVGTDAGNKAVSAGTLAQKLIGMLTSAELVNGLKLSDLTKTTTLAATDYVMAGLTAGNRAMTAKNLATALEGLLTSQEFISALKMGELAQASSLTASDNILIGTTTGNKYMKAADALYAILDAFAAPEVHRNFFGGRNLGSVVTAEQKAAIQNGTFKGLFVGDYWVINGVTWRIADMDYFYNAGSTALTKHHLVIVPDKNLYSAKMNDTSSTEGGYYNSKMHTEYLEQARTAIATAFGSLVLTHKEYLTNAVTNGHPSGRSSYDVTVELMNEIMVYGCNVYTPMNNGVTIPSSYTLSNQQLALFALDPKKVNTGETYWLQDVVSATCFAFVNFNGIAYYDNAVSSNGVRPYFCAGQ